MNTDIRAKIMNIIDEHKMDINDADYLEICNALARSLKNDQEYEIKMLEHLLEEQQLEIRFLKITIHKLKVKGADESAFTRY